jgi:hypothetical protein
MGRTLARLRRLAPAASMAAILLLPATALAAGTSIQVVSATLIAKGAEIDVTVSFTCPAGDIVPNDQQPQAGLVASAQEAISKSQQASGFGRSAGGQTCTGSPQTAVIQVLANAPGAPFRVGPAVISAQLTECDPSFVSCTSTNSGLTTVRISK